MHYLIETPQQLVQFEQQINNYEKCFINIITLNDQYHPALTSPSLIYINVNDKGFVIALNHSEALLAFIDLNSIYKLLNKFNIIYVLDEKFHYYYLSMPNRQMKRVRDVNFIRVDNNKKPINDVEYNTSSHHHISSMHHNYPRLDYIIPISKHYEKWENIYTDIKNDLTSRYFDFNKDLSYTFFNIEKCGIKIDSERFRRYYDLDVEEKSIKNNRIFSCFNLYNVTARPSNTFNGVNFAAIPKNARSAFVGTNGSLVEIDYREFHPRLIARLVGYDLDKTKSIYEWFGEKIHKSPEEAKKLIFKQLYGGIEDEYKNLVYFKLIDEFSNKEFNKYTANNYLELISGRRVKVEDPTPSKILSYLTQNLETYYNVYKIQSITGKLSTIDWMADIVHYNYDSILIDISENHIPTNLIKDMSIDFPIKVSRGINYKELQNYNF